MTPEQEAQEESEARKLLGNAKVQFWVCPVREHGERKNTVTVTWEGHVARCTSPGCGMTSEGTRRLQKASYEAGYDKGLEAGRAQGIKHNNEAVKAFLAESNVLHPPLPGDTGGV